jgi:uncharacterized protein YegP (UPF0339 family)
MAAKFEIRSPKAGEFRWVLTSQGRTLAIGETYSRRASAEKAIESLRAAAATATIDDTTARRGAKPAVAKAARTSGKALGRATGTTKKTARAAAKKTAKAPAAAKRTVNKAAKAAEKTAAKAAKKTTTPRKGTTRSR